MKLADNNCQHNAFERKFAACAPKIETFMAPRVAGQNNVQE
ncbi:hypothetical protein GGR27_000775 [Lewinella antarctica]|uniref:Uncharacterized protein n=1 Tax=Neolewinella antarctica TaxID=442734 RepID=A0ABX0X8L3_9BACT|nr:hypothetical protein [Neolewinella antarctica]